MSLQLLEIFAELAADANPILQGVDLTINPGEVHVLMGPNGSGKSTLGKVLMGHPDYELTKGKILIDGVEMNGQEPEERAQAGIFLANQYPTEIPGVKLPHFLRLAYNSVHDTKLSVHKFRKLLKPLLIEVGLGEEFLERDLNVGFSGGEKKKCEILQLLILQPKYAILDETDSGLDVDAVRTVFTTLAEIIPTRKDMGVLLITHYHRVFDYLKPTHVHIFKQGRIIRSGGIELAQEIDSDGYEGVN